MSISLSRRACVALFTLALGLLAVSAVGAQTLGPFKWQLQPYCNVLTVSVTQVGGTYRLDGFDDQCGAGHAAATGEAFLNPNGTVGLGISIVATPSGAPVHVDASISLTTLSGTWRDNRFLDGTFAFGASAPGSPRSQAMNVNAFAVDNPAYVLGVGARGSRETPLAPLVNQPLAVLGGAGFVGNLTGGASAKHSGFMTVTATENWGIAGWGSRLDFSTTPNGATSALRRLSITDLGNVGIGSVAPTDRLDVQGDIRVGNSVANGCVKNNAGNPLVGVCASDLRFKRDITPFAAMLERVAQLQPVHYYWRAAEFPARHFGPDQAYGLIAQEVAAVLPEIVATDETGYQAVDYSKLPLLAIQAIKELKGKNDALERRLGALETLRDYERR